MTRLEFTTARHRATSGSLLHGDVSRATGSDGRRVGDSQLRICRFWDCKRESPEVVHQDGGAMNPAQSNHLLNATFLLRGSRSVAGHREVLMVVVYMLKLIVDLTNTTLL